MAGDVRDLLARHHRVTGDLDRLPAGVEIVRAEQGGALVRTALPASELPLRAGPVSLEELVLAYMSRANTPVARVGAVAGEGAR